ncbi:MAG: mechanosensitive ion channel family protein, partial [Pirellulales bacterium]|nr:mechanosensitive ion channel family protein [Pirellulales bacterium]
ACKIRSTAFHAAVAVFVAAWGFVECSSVRAGDTDAKTPDTQNESKDATNSESDANESKDNESKASESTDTDATETESTDPDDGPALSDDISEEEKQERKEEAQEALEEVKKHPLEPSDTSSPRDTLMSFIDAVDRVYKVIRAMERGDRSSDVRTGEVATARIISCLDMSQTPEYLRSYESREAAVCLKEILDRIEIPPFNEIPGKAEVKEAEKDGDGLKRWTIPGTEITITRVEEGPRTGQYLFSPATVADARTYYERVKHLPYKPGATEGIYRWFLSEPGGVWLSVIVHALPDWVQNRYYGQAVWQWVGLFLTLLFGAAVMQLAYSIGRWQARSLLERRSIIKYWLTIAFPIAAMVVPVVINYYISEKLVISGTTLAVTKFLVNLVFLFAVMIVVVSVGNRIAAVLISSPEIHPKGVDAQLIRIVTRVVSLVAATIVFLEGGQYLGIPLTTLLAGAGVGGLAFALAAQDALKNFFGSMMIILDKPFRVGERIQAKGYDGVVEEIGLRSTKLRLLTGHQATIPNEDMARVDIENIGRRPHIRRVADLPIRLDTSPEKAERAVAIIRELLDGHEGSVEDFPPRVFLNEINHDALNVRVIYWYAPPNYWDYLAYCEKLNLEIKRRFDAEGIHFALPATTTVLEQSENQAIDVKVAGKS